MHMYVHHVMQEREKLAKRLSLEGAQNPVQQQVHTNVHTCSCSLLCRTCACENLEQCKGNEKAELGFQTHNLQLSVYVVV